MTRRQAIRTARVVYVTAHGTHDSFNVAITKREAAWLADCDDSTDDGDKQFSFSYDAGERTLHIDPAHGAGDDLP